jgi:hypothetical protein
MTQAFRTDLNPNVVFDLSDRLTWSFGGVTGDI